MPSITALLHAHNDARRLGRALETLRCCDQILIVDYGSQDRTLRVARQYGASIYSASETSSAKEWIKIVTTDWVFLLEARESLSEALEATLLDWKSQAQVEASGTFSTLIREETSAGWRNLPSPQVRLAPRTWPGWTDRIPLNSSSSILLEGDVLCFSFP